MNRDEQIQNIIRKVNDSEIASIKTVLIHIIDVLNNPDSTAKDLKNAIELDPPLTGKILRIANSAYYASRTKIDSLDKAIVWLGFSSVRELAVHQKTVEIFSGGAQVEGYSRENLWQHCIAVAQLVKSIYRKEFGERGEHAYITGILHQMGIIILDQFYPEAFREIATISARKEQNFAELERQTLGITHAEIGAAVLGHWGLPEDIVQPVLYHHSPTAAPMAVRKASMALFVADNMCQINEVGFTDSPVFNEPLFERCLDALKLNYKSLEALYNEVLEALLNMSTQGLFSRD